MTLRLDGELDAELTALAKAEHLSKQQIVGRALREYLDRNRRVVRITDLARQAAADYPETLRRLGE